MDGLWLAVDDGMMALEPMITREDRCEAMRGLVFEVHTHRRSAPSAAAPEPDLRRNRWPSLILADSQHPSAVFAEPGILPGRGTAPLAVHAFHLRDLCVQTVVHLDVVLGGGFSYDPADVLDHLPLNEMGIARNKASSRGRSNPSPATLSMAS
ncbi:hypothetical protein [Nonomuraea sp. NPDC050783]|uniref:hypothetical protein n=1 Tax=Nonomuraea sp. NPDC050783 TaxID=3154634 RepID=UPI00346650BC